MLHCVWQLFIPPVASSNSLSVGNETSLVIVASVLSDSFSCILEHCSRTSSIPEVVCIYSRCLSPSLHFKLSFGHYLTFLKPPAFGNLCVPVAIFTFGATGLMLGPAAGSRRWHSSHIFLGLAEKAVVTSHVRKNCLVAWPPREFSCLMERSDSVLFPKPQCIPGWKLICFKLELRQVWMRWMGSCTAVGTLGLNTKSWNSFCFRNTVFKIFPLYLHFLQVIVESNPNSSAWHPQFSMDCS